MENLRIRKNKIGRPKYRVNIKQLKELFVKVRNKEITNEERLENSQMWQNQMVRVKKNIWR